MAKEVFSGRSRMSGGQVTGLKVVDIDFFLTADVEVSLWFVLFACQWCAVRLRTANHLISSVKQLAVKP